MLGVRSRAGGLLTTPPDTAADNPTHGDRTKALAMIKELNHKSVQGYVSQLNLAVVYLGIGVRERAVGEDLEKAYSPTSPWLALDLRMDRIFDP
jgi:hypothetical protein